MRKYLVTALAPLLMISACGDPTAEPEGITPPGTSIGGKGDIIGEDDRRDEYSTDVSDALRALGRSTAMIIDRSIISPDTDGHVRLISETLGASYYMCPGETFREQPVTGMCSAWLVAPDIMVTNGHCITSQVDCDNKSFVFDYAITHEDQDINRVHEDNIVACDRVLAWDYTNNCDVDYAVIKLAREVRERTPLDVRRPEDTFAQDNLVIIGHPFGLPRKYAISGQVIGVGDNAFTTTHDIFGGNSGSAIFDAESGAVQGLVTCGGSNLNWHYWDQDWRLDRKTGQPCHMTCDEEGIYAEGTWEDGCYGGEGERRRCVCDGNQLVWEKRPCLSFEEDTQGQCTTEYQVEEFTCLTAPWLCATPTSQHTNHFAHFIDSWKVASNTEPLPILAYEDNTIEGSGEYTTSLEIETPGLIQAATVYLDFIGDTDPDAFTGAWLVEDLDIVLTHDASGDEMSLELVAQNTIHHGTAYELTNIPGATTQPFTVPFLLNELAGRDLAATWTLKITNRSTFEYTLHSWHVQGITKDDVFELAPIFLPCTEGCDYLDRSMPDPIVDNFDSDAAENDDELVPGTIAADWHTEVYDTNGEGYEVFKTRRSQTLTLLSGEFAIARDFGEDLGYRQITVDYRYDGDGWFQIWADNQVIFGKTEFAQGVSTIALPATARKISFVLGATDDSRHHELTIYSLQIAE